VHTGHPLSKLELSYVPSSKEIPSNGKGASSPHIRTASSYGILKDLLPPRKITNNMAKETLENRREALEHYLQKLLNRYHYIQM